MRRHQKLIDERALPDAVMRWTQFEHASTCLGAAGYQPIGVDHFAKPDDPLTRAQSRGVLRRNFQGYTVDATDALIGLGPSAIGALPEAYVQNQTPLHAWRDAVNESRFAIAHCLVLDDEDRLRHAVIERLMCDLKVDLAASVTAFDRGADHFAGEIERLDKLASDGIIERDGMTIKVPEPARPLVRIAAAVFEKRAWKSRSLRTLVGMF